MGLAMNHADFELILNLLVSLGLGILILRQRPPARGEKIIVPAVLFFLAAWLTANIYFSGRLFSPVLVVLIACVLVVDAALYLRLWLRSRSQA